MVEFALVFALLLMIALGAFEYGMVFRDSLTVSTAAREAGRVGASTAEYGEADCVILEAAAGALQSLTSGSTSSIHVYKSNETGDYAVNPSFANIYQPAGSQTPDLECNGGSSWLETIGGNWNPDDRVNTEGGADWIGVRIEYDHEWITNFLWWNGTMGLSEDSVFRMEPPAPGATTP